MIALDGSVLKVPCGSVRNPLPVSLTASGSLPFGGRKGVAVPTGGGLADCAIGLVVRAGVGEPDALAAGGVPPHAASTMSTSKPTYLMAIKRQTEPPRYNAGRIGQFPEP